MIGEFASFACSVCQLFVLYSTFYFNMDPKLFTPIVTKPFGHLTFLTVQFNILLTVFFLASLCASIFAVPAQDAWLQRFFPLAFALGSFLTFAHYALDQFNAVSVHRRQQASHHPFVQWVAHIEHALALPVVVLCAISLVPAPASQRASLGDVGMFVGG